MPTKVIMPQLGESVVEGTVSKWLKVVGDPVEEFEPILEINTDKVDSEIPSPAAGVLTQILVEEGQIVQAGTVLAMIGDNDVASPPDEKAASPAERRAPEKIVPVAPSAAHPAATTPEPGRDRQLGFISPVVARIASEHQVDLNQVSGTGQSGRITKKDVLAYIEQRDRIAAMAEQAAAAAQTKTPESIPAPAALAPSPAPIDLQPGEIVPLSAVRRAIAEHMVFSKRTSPHVTTVMEADLSRVTAHRAANKATFARDGVNLTYTAYLIMAAVAALKANPLVNSSWREEGILLHRSINIGMATSLGEEGLIVPVIKNADSFSLLGLARTINDLADRARSRKLQPEEVKGGTFTLTNHGTSGSLFATPIINQPQCAILGAGMIQKRVVVITDPQHGDSIAIRPMVYLSLTFDHRILDGAAGDGFLASVVEYLQNWD